MVVVWHQIIVLTVSDDKKNGNGNGKGNGNDGNGNGGNGGMATAVETAVEETVVVEVSND